MAAWLYLLLLRGDFWRTAKTRFHAEAAAQASASVVALVPARNEAATIGRCVASLLSQAGDSPAHVIVVDDESTDDTAARAQEAAAEIGRSSDLTVLKGARLPPGWSGKVWAMQQGVLAAEEFHPDFFLFTDADVVHSPDNVARLLSKASAGFDLVSQMVKLHCATWAEKWLIPAFVYFFFQLYPPGWVIDKRNKTAAAAGGCILVRADALRKAGGLQSIRSAIIDDCALAKAVKGSGSTIYLGLSESAASLRSYGSAEEIRKMISRTAFNQLRHSSLLLTIAVVLMGLVYLAPIALYFTGCRTALMLASAACLMMTISYLPMVGFFGVQWWWSLSLPFAAFYYIYATVRSALDFYSGSGGRWKGRIQDRC